MNLTKEEQSLLSALEANQFESVLTPARKKELEAYARNTFEQDENINIKISIKDLTAIQSQAKKEGMAYQDFVAKILHKWAAGSLQDLTSNP